MTSSCRDFGLICSLTRGCSSNAETLASLELQLPWLRRSDGAVRIETKEQGSTAVYSLLGAKQEILGKANNTHACKTRRLS